MSNVANEIWHLSNIGLGKKGKGPYTFPLGTDPDQALANARLAVSSLELLQALKHIVQKYEELFDYFPIAFQSCIDIAETAIAKAEKQDSTST